MRDERSVSVTKQRRVLDLRYRIVAGEMYGTVSWYDNLDKLPVF